MTSKASELYQALCDEFPDAMQSITSLSRNDAGNKDFIISDIQAFNFDKIKNYGITDSEQKEKTPDSLFLHNDTLYFVEFKEGDPANIDKTDIRGKIHEAIITLFQYAKNRKITTREQFLELSIKYAVIMRFRLKKGARPQSFFDTLEATKNFFNLKNMEGLLIKETTVKINAKSIFDLLNKISNGNITNIEVMSADQTEKKIYPPPQHRQPNLPNLRPAHSSDKNI